MKVFEKWNKIDLGNISFSTKLELLRWCLTNFKSEDEDIMRFYGIENTLYIKDDSDFTWFLVNWYDKL